MDNKFRIGIYPGSFDPITNGHLDILFRALPLFDKIIILVANNANKDYLFTLEERLSILKEIVSTKPNLEIDSLQETLLVDYCEKHKASAIIRGLRAVADFEYEYAITLMNRRLAPEIETIFFMTSESHSFLSSSIVKEVASLGRSVEELVPEPVHKMLINKFPNYSIK